MELTGKSCKLCLKYIQGDGLVTLDDHILDKLEFLQLSMDQSIEESNSLCKECNEKINNAFEFKTCVISGAKSSSESQNNKPDIPSTSSAETIRCHMCKNFVTTLSMISLTKLLKDDCVMEVFQGHLQEVDLKNTDENATVCDLCQKYLGNFSMLVSYWLVANDCNGDDDIKDNIADFEMIEVKEENAYDSHSIEVSDSKSVSIAKQGKGKKGQSTSDAGGSSSSSSPKKIKMELDAVIDSNDSTFVTVKKEEIDENEATEINEELHLTNEELNIKDEVGETVRKKEKNTFDKQINFKCRKCEFIGSNKKSLRQHELMHIMELKYVIEIPTQAYQRTSGDEFKNHKVVQVFKCRECAYENKSKAGVMSHHNQSHIKIYEWATLKCRDCPFETKYKGAFIKHISALKHKIYDRDEIRLFKCQKCDYSTINEICLKRHVWYHIHKKEMKTY